jgi:hypothetical protein
VYELPIVCWLTTLMLNGPGPLLDSLEDIPGEKIALWDLGDDASSTPHTALIPPLGKES